MRINVVLREKPERSWRNGFQLDITLRVISRVENLKSIRKGTTRTKKLR